MNELISDQGNLFVISGDAEGRTVYEVVRFNPKFGSWLIADTVQKGACVLLYDNNDNYNNDCIYTASIPGH